MDLGTLKYIITNTLIGEITIVWDDSNNIIKQIVLPDSNTKKSNPGNIAFTGVLFESHPNDTIRKLISNIKEAVKGTDVKFDLDKMDLSSLTDFQRLVLEKQFEIPHGFVTTYKILAQMIDKPRSARPVANVLAANPFPILIPCHRTVLSSWEVGGYAGIRSNYYKKFLLVNEGVKIDGDLVDKKSHFTGE